jgi:ribosomal protein S18 acetylase RimI-like enzyme
MPLKYIKVNKEHRSILKEIANLHMEGFGSYFLTSLGYSFIYEYYKSFLDDSNSIFFVALDEDKVMSFIVLSKKPQLVIRRLLMRSLGKILKIVLKKIITFDKKFLIDIAGKLISFLKSIIKQGKSQSRGPNHYRLLSIATRNSMHGSGVTSKLMNYMLKNSSSRGIQSIGLSVFADNERAISFYKKYHFTFEKQKSEMQYYVLYL